MVYKVSTGQPVNRETLFQKKARVKTHQGLNKLLLFPLFIINVQNIQNQKKKLLKSIVVLTQDPAQNQPTVFIENN